MRGLKLSQENLGLSSFLERITRTQVKDCFTEDDTIYVVVEPGQLGKVVGKGGSNIHRIQEELHKRVRVIEFREHLADFIKNIIYPLTVQEIVEESGSGSVIIRDSNKKTKSLLIGRDGKNLAVINRMVKRFFNTEVKVM